MLLVQVGAHLMWGACTPGVPCKWKKTQQEIFQDVVYNRVPKVKAFADARDFSHIGAARADGLYAPRRDCVKPFIDGFKSRIGSTLSSPELVHEIYGYLGLADSRDGRRVVADIWNASVDFEPMVDQIATCARENRPLHETLCGWLDDPSIALTLHESQEDVNNSDALTFAMHEVLVLERLAREGVRSRSFRNFIAAHFAAKSDLVEDAIVRVSREQNEPEDLAAFKVEKWNSIFMPSQELTYMNVAGGMPSEAVSRLQKNLMLNIIEATDIDRSMGVTLNADIGVTLAASAVTATPYVGSEERLVWSFSKEWFDAYNAWNLNYVTTFNTLHLPPKLLIPSILCTSDDSVRDGWITARMMSLKSIFLPMSFEGSQRKRKQRVIKATPERRQGTARISAQHLEIDAPARCCGFNTLYSMFQMLKPYPLEMELGSNVLRSEWFMVYFLLVAWLSVVLAGLGSEVVLGELLARLMVESRNGFVAWHFAQLTFSLLLTASFTASDGIGLIFLPIGLWKMGFPETVSSLISFSRSKRKASLAALAELCNGFGTLLHHFSTSLVITGILLHVFPRDRALTAGCVVPILQHIFVLVKYHLDWLYIAIELGLEIWFQIEVISNVSEFDSLRGLEITNMGRGLALSMLLSHYLYLVAAALKILCDVLSSCRRRQQERRSGSGKGLSETTPARWSKVYIQRAQDIWQMPSRYGPRGAQMPPRAAGARRGTSPSRRESDCASRPPRKAELCV